MCPFPASAASLLVKYSHGTFSPAHSPPYAQDTYVVSPVLVTNHHYGLAWNSLVDPQTFIMRYAEPDYLNTSTAAHDWVGLTIGMIQPRYDTTFNYPSFGLGGACPANNFPCSNLGQIQMPLLPKNTVPPPGSAFGTATFPGRPNNNTVTVMLSPNISAQVLTCEGSQDDGPPVQF